MMLTHTAAAIEIVKQLGRPLTVNENRRLRAWCPRGVWDDDIPAIVDKLNRPRSHIRLVKKS